MRPAGFAYLFLLFVIAITAISVLAVGSLQYHARIRAEEKELLRVGNEFRRALQSYRSHSTEGTLPTSLDQLLEDRRQNILRRHLRKIHVDPVTRTHEWGVVREGGRIVGIHSLSDRQPMKIGGFSDENRSFEGAERYSEWIFSVGLDAAVVPGIPPGTVR